MRVLSIVTAFVAASVMFLVAPSASAATDSGTFVGVDSARLLDTRTGNGAPKAAVAPGGTVTFQVLGRGGVPASNVSAAALNVTVTGATRGGYVTVFPGGGTQPLASNLNFVAGQTIANHVTVGIGAPGTVSIKNGSGGTVQLVADVNGYYVGGEATSGGTFTSLVPDRVLDTRNGTGSSIGAVPSNGSVTVQVAGAGGVPSTGVAAVALNVTVTSPTRGGYLTVHPSDQTRPVVSNLNFNPGQTIANAVAVMVSATGQVTFYNGSGGTVQIVADVNGWFRTFAETPVPGAFEAPGPPFRFIDSRSASLNPFASTEPMPAWYCWILAVAPPGATRAGVFNITVTQPTAGGYLVAYAGDLTFTPPTASTINFSKGLTIPNLATVKTSLVDQDASLMDADYITICNGSSGTTHVVVDYTGFYVDDPTAVVASLRSPASIAGELSGTPRQFAMPH